MNPGLFDGDLVEAAWFDVEVTDGGQYHEELVAEVATAITHNLLLLLGVGQSMLAALLLQEEEEEEVLEPPVVQRVPRARAKLIVVADHETEATVHVTVTTLAVVESTVATISSVDTKVEVKS